MIEIDHLSHSSIRTYLWCPRMWRYRYVEKIRVPRATALLFGSAFHNAVEAFITACVSDEDYDGVPSDHWMAAWDEQNYGDIAWEDEGEEEELYNLGHKMLSREVKLSGSGPPAEVSVGQFLRSLVPACNERGVLQLEMKVNWNVPGVPVPLVGYIDIITEDGVPGDFKTSSRKWYGNKAHEQMQATAYLSALRQLGDYAGGKFRYYIFPKTKKPQAQVINTERGLERLMWYAGLVTHVWRGIEAEYFPPNPTNWLCPKYCDYSEPCGRVI